MRVLARGRLTLLYLGAVVMLFSGLFTSWGGAVRWKDCWRVEPFACPTMGDEFGLFPEGRGPGAVGAAEPLAIGSALAFVAVVLLVLALRQRVLALITVVIAVPLLQYAHWWWTVAYDRSFAPDDSGLLSLPGGLLAFGGITVLAMVGFMRALATDDTLGMCGWSALGVLGAGYSLLDFLIPEAFSDSWDDPTWMWSFGGTLTVLGAMFLAWALGRWGRLAPPAAAAAATTPAVASEGADTHAIV